MKKVLLFLVMISMCFVGLFAAEQQWEYMVVSFGKSYFSDYNIRALAYLDDGLSVSVQEAKSVERSLDVLGQEGWEIVDVTGTIGGDQQITLKRVFDANRTENDWKKASEKQAELTKAALSLAEYLESTITEEEGPRKLIDFDAVDQENRLKATSEANSAAIKESLVSLFKNKGITYSSIKTSYNADLQYYSVSVYVDLTADYLVDGIGYRKSQTDAKIASIASIARDASFDKNSSCYLYVYGTIELDGVSNTVGSSNWYYSKYSKKWENR